jgi:hypothetical protein
MSSSLDRLKKSTICLCIWPSRLGVVRNGGGSSMTPLISPLFFLTGTGMILVTVGAVGCWQRGKPSLWSMVRWGALAWTASLALKAAAGLPMMNFFQRHADNPMIWLCGGLLTGVFECVIPLLLILKTRLRRADFNGAVAFGIGFGGIEVFLMGSVALVQTMLLVAFPNHIPAEVRDALLKQFAHSSIATILLPIIERASALAAHCSASVLIIYAVRTRRQLWFWLSFGYKTLIDALAAWAILAIANRACEGWGSCAGAALSAALIEDGVDYGLDDSLVVRIPKPLPHLSFSAGLVARPGLVFGGRKWRIVQWAIGEQLNKLLLNFWWQW